MKLINSGKGLKLLLFSLLGVIVFIGSDISPAKADSAVYFGQNRPYVSHPRRHRHKHRLRHFKRNHRYRHYYAPAYYEYAHTPWYPLRYVRRNPYSYGASYPYRFKRRAFYRRDCD